ncbi:Beta-1,3-galactosyltransferase [Echinococcus granulosus]|uniref:Hexosyltransferase n=1 Tax=Echinococcus granulosus TaxID=6210 RepID=W6UCS5_ECHGR|nr:Beta-1,3-galactosyltransferase [Echinococcus granulosus]EUB58546.1 Beta-1,3-galactosyltransferase [Echinococcus granulosus]
MCADAMTVAPIFNPRIRFLKVPSSICSPLTAARVTDGIIFGSSHPNVVIIYKSAVYNFKERNQIRKLYYLSYTDVNIHLIFSIGLPRTSLGNVFQRDGFNVTLQSKAGQRLLEHSRFPSRAKTQLIREMHKYNDLLVGDYEDSYFNLTLKQFHSFQWAARFCRPYKPTFVFLDDDFAVNTDKLVNFVRNKTREQLESLNYGYKMNVNPVVRYPSEYPQWALSKREIPWPMHAPQYYGMYSLWSYRHVHDIALAMHFTKPLVLEDTWLGLVQHKLNLTFAKLIGMFSHNSLMSKQVRCSNIFFALISDLRLRHCISLSCACSVTQNMNQQSKELSSHMRERDQLSSDYCHADNSCFECHEEDIRVIPLVLCCAKCLNGILWQTSFKFCLYRFYTLLAPVLYCSCESGLIDGPMPVSLFVSKATHLRQ